MRHSFAGNVSFAALIALAALPATLSQESPSTTDDAAAEAAMPDGLPQPGSDEYLAVRAEFVAGLAGYDEPEERIFRLGEIAYIERPGGLEEFLAEQALKSEMARSQFALYRLYYQGDPIARQRVLALFREDWATLGRGSSGHRAEMVRDALRHEDWRVRREAGLLVSEFPFYRIGHAAVDAAIDDPRLTRAALAAVRVNREWHNTRWTMEQLDHPDPETRVAALHTLAAIGRPGAKFIVPEIGSDDPRRRVRAVRALLTIATSEDLSVLFRWLSDHGDDDESLRDEVTRALAGIEAGSYRPELPDLPDVGLE